MSYHIAICDDNDIDLNYIFTFVSEWARVSELIVGNKTAIYISHRLSSCRFCDDIVVFDSGEIVQHGNHDQLVEDDRGKYYELWYAQAQYYQ